MMQSSRLRLLIVGAGMVIGGAAVGIALAQPLEPLGPMPRPLDRPCHCTAWRPGPTDAPCCSRCEETTFSCGTRCPEPNENACCGWIEQRTPCACSPTIRTCGVHTTTEDDATLTCEPSVDNEADEVQTECRSSCMMPPGLCYGKTCSKHCPANKCAHCSCGWVVVPCGPQQPGPTCFEAAATCECI